jgi:hypothetical protein
MFRRRKKKNKTVSESPPESPPSDQTPNIDRSPRTTTVSAHPETKTSPLLSDAFKTTIEKAADRSKSELISEGKIKPMAFFVEADGTMKTVSLSVKDEYQKEGLIQRIQEKVLAENISTVIILTEMDDNKGAVLSGASAGMKGSAQINYSFDKTTKTFASWKLIWLDKSAQNVFLEGIFDNKG